jgi:hypothetical protein
MLSYIWRFGEYNPQHAIFSSMVANTWTPVYLLSNVCSVFLTTWRWASPCKSKLFDDSYKTKNKFQVIVYLSWFRTVRWPSCDSYIRLNLLTKLC